MVKRGQLKQLIFIFGVLLLFSIVAIAQNNNSQASALGLVNNSTSLLQEAITNQNQSIGTLDPDLATVVDGKSIFDDPYLSTYMKKFNNLRDVQFKTLQERGGTKINFTSGNFVERKVEGFRLGNKNYGVHMTSCFKDSEECVFRINGLYTRLSPKSNPFDLDGKYAVVVNVIHYDHCDEYPCDYFFDAYDLVEAEVIER